jgi:hypothetical protein
MRTGALFAGLLLPKIVATALVRGTNVDGGYYTDAALHVRDGAGLVSDVSLYHAGVPSFPYPTPIYPLWPWLLGMAARAVDMGVLVHWLPAALYAVSLVGAFLLGRSLFPREVVAGFHGGHLMALLLGIQHEYFVYTSLPYTEGLAMALLTFALWRAVTLPETALAAVELGLWMSLLVLTRSQMLFVPIAAAAAFALRGAWLRGAVALGIVAGALVAWWLRNRGIVADAGLGSILRFDQAQVTTVLSPIEVLAPTQGVLDFVLDRLEGVLVAFDPTDPRHSYARGFHTLQWALPVALVAAVRERPRVGASRFVAALLAFVSLGALLSVHLPHKIHFGEWYFHRRHAIPCVVPFFLALVFVLRSRARVVGLAILASTCVLGAWAVGDEIEDAWTAPAHQPEDDLVAWLEAQETPLVVAVAAFTPPELAWRTDGIGYHWFYQRTSLADLERMFDRLGAQYLVFDPRKTKRWLFVREGFERGFERLSDAPGGFAVYRRVRR